MKLEENMNKSICKDCCNRSFCGDKGLGNCEHFDISYTRSEVFDMLTNADDNSRRAILSAVENVYKIKLAY